VVGDPGADLRVHLARVRVQRPAVEAGVDEDRLADLDDGRPAAHPLGVGAVAPEVALPVVPSLGARQPLEPARDRQEVVVAEERVDAAAGPTGLAFEPHHGVEKQP
jgi:hypothetical protein